MDLLSVAHCTGCGNKQVLSITEIVVDHLVDGWETEGVRSSMDREVRSKSSAKVPKGHPEGTFQKWNVF